MVKAEWGTKRTCPKCGIRFYDLGKEDPVVCIECGNQWTPEPVLKSKQPIPFEEAAKEEGGRGSRIPISPIDDLEDIDEDDDSPDNDVDLGGDDDLGVPGARTTTTTIADAGGQTGWADPAQVACAEITPCQARDVPIKGCLPASGRGSAGLPGPAGNEWNGALAQLGERLHGMQEVSGSIPLGSTIHLIIHAWHGRALISTLADEVSSAGVFRV